MLLFRKSSLKGCFKLRHVTKRALFQFSCNSNAAIFVSSVQEFIGLTGKAWKLFQMWIICIIINSVTKYYYYLKLLSNKAISLK